MPVVADTPVPLLPDELARKIVQLSLTLPTSWVQSCRDVCSATSACKAFWAWGNALSFVQARMITPNSQSLDSLLRFQLRRAPLGLKVETLHLHFRGMVALPMKAMEDLQLNIRCCSATLTELYLDNLDVGDWISDPHTSSGFACSGLKDAICQCKQLRSLQVVFGADEEAAPPPDASGLLMDFAAALPNLSALHWREEPRRGQRAHLATRFTFDAFIDRPWIDRKAAESLAGPGLRLLQAEQCTFEAVPALPASLQICSLRHWGRENPPLHGRFDLLLAPCAALRELHILQCTLGVGASLDLPAVAASCPALRALVVHVLMEEGRGAAPAFGRGEAVLPGLEVLALISIDLDSDHLILRAPALEVLALDLIHAPNLARGLLESAGPRLRHLQLVMRESGRIWDSFWRAVKACTELAALQLVFLPEFAQTIDQQICGFMGTALTAGPLCLPKLAHIALYLEEHDTEDDAAFHLGVPLAPEQGAQGVCNALGRLVAAGVLPALAQVVLYPCVHDFDLKWKGGRRWRGMQCDGAPHVEVTCRRSVMDSGYSETFCSLRKPERCAHLGDAAMRAFDALDL